MEMCPYSYFGWCGYFWGPGCHLLQQILSEDHKNYFKDWCLIHSQPTFLFLTQWIMAILSKGCKPDNLESHNSQHNIWGFCSYFVEYECFLESNSPDILALCETNLDDSIDSDNFFVRGCLSLIQKNSITHMHSLAVHVKEGLPFTWDLSLGICRFLPMFSTGFTSFSVVLLFPLSISFFVSTHSFDSISSKCSQSTYLLMYLSLETLTSIIRTGLT